MSLSLLAKELNVPVSKLLPLIEQGYLRTIDPQTVEAPPPAGLLWLRQWFQPPLAKPLFSQADIAAILEIEESAVPALAAAHDAPVSFDPALGVTFSLWAARRLILDTLSTGTRFDRQALIWFLLGNPANACPPFQKQLELEIERVGELPEPERSIRKEGLLRHWRDAKALVGIEALESVEKAFRRL